MIVESKNLKDIYRIIGFFLFCISSLFQDYITTTESSILLYILYFFSVIFLICSISRKGCLFLSKKNLKFAILWIVMALVFVIGYNEGIHRSSYFVTIRWLYFFLVMFIISYISKERYSSMLKMLGAVASLYVFGVYFFRVFPQSYNIMYKHWGYWPTGTNNGVSGFRAGFASHYSENAMFISLLIFIIVSFLLNERKRYKKLIQIFFLVLSFGALMLTTKRAHLLFVFFSIVFAYYILKPEKRSNRTFKIIIGSTIGFVALYICSFFVPVVADIFNRFSTIGEDTESMTRFSMWALALKNFKENPILGIGWNGYKYQFFQYLYNPKIRAERYAFLNAHNVYLQLLSETGVIGFSLFIGGAIKAFIRTIMIFEFKDATQEIKSVLIFSIMMQAFFFMYSFTGNCLYDIMFSFFSVAVGISIGCCCQRD